MKTPARLEFVGISSYGAADPAPAKSSSPKTSDVSVEGHDVIVVEDIVR